MPHLNSEPRFPNSACACESNQAILLEKIDDLALFFLATNKGSK